MIRVRIERAEGSTPREAGTEMGVTAGGQQGTIGGGRLEWEACAHARAMLAQGRTSDRRAFPLGPALGQCCGGAVTLSFEAVEALAPPTGAPLWIWGAGHVGRALVQVMAPLPDLALTWIDTAADRFPDAVPDGVAPLVAADPVRVVPRAPRDARHLVLTYSHELDLALCDALLRHGFAEAGLIGSATKWARFRRRLRALGHADAQISRIACPIGDPVLGKHPQAIAVGVAATLLRSAGRTHDARDGATGLGAA